MYPASQEEYRSSARPSTVRPMLTRQQARLANSFNSPPRSIPTIDLTYDPYADMPPLEDVKITPPQPVPIVVPPNVTRPSWEFIEGDLIMFHIPCTWGAGDLSSYLIQWLIFFGKHRDRFPPVNYDYPPSMFPSGGKWFVIFDPHTVDPIELLSMFEERTN